MDKKQKAPKYKIGTLAKQFNISPGTVRYYEDEGLLVSLRMEQSNTRQYQARNIKALFSIRRYLALGFTIAEIKALFHCESHHAIADRMTRKQAELHAEIARLQRLDLMLEEQKRRLAGIDQLNDQIEVGVSPEMTLVISQEGQVLTQSHGTREAVRQIMLCLPDTFAVSVVPMVSVMGKTNERFSGFGLTGRQTLPSCPALRSCPSRLSMHTIKALSGSLEAQGALFADCRAYAAANNLHIIGDAVGRSIAIINEEKSLSHLQEDAYRPSAIYYEYWIPVEKI